MPKWHFSTPAWNLTFFWAKCLHFKCYESAILWFYPKFVSKCLSQWIKVDKWDYSKNPSQALKISFCLGFLWIPRRTGRQNWRCPIFLRFNLVKYQCVITCRKEEMATNWLVVWQLTSSHIQSGILHSLTSIILSFS